MHKNIFRDTKLKKVITKKIIKSWEKTVSWQMTKEERINIAKKTWVTNEKDVKKK